MCSASFWGRSSGGRTRGHRRCLDERSQLRCRGSAGPGGRSPMLLHDRFDYYARARGELPFAQHGELVMTYAEARARANRIAHALDARPGERVAVLGRNSVDAALLYFACSKSGAVPVPINPALAPAEVAFIVED